MAMLWSTVSERDGHRQAGECLLRIRLFFGAQMRTSALLVALPGITSNQGSPMGKLDGKTVVITGGVHSIGAAYVRAAAAEGANVAVCDVLDAASIVAEIGDKAWGRACDVSDRESVESFVAEAIERFGGVDGLVNNAAVFASLKDKPFENIDPDEFDLVMKVNIRGVFEMCRAVLPSMRARGYGKIVNISSGTLLKGSSGMAHYVASKGAVIALTRVIARESGKDGVRVNCVAPGFMLSDGGHEWGTDATEGLSAPSIASRCLPRDQEPEDLNGAVMFLLSPESDFISGQTLAVDGGSVMIN
ncbi:SDR family NAD(P)-dependent oxidoreductase [Mesorhizobium sp.]|uniref:SDR family NAD(P)-dependent oxidoreductase n=1 Tax=Mesorhizobium sp. TaxID=1871066 RepID=UPI0025BD0281|nr:SDR family oxidoreductase [Mesorhizobium sp.]